MVQNNIQSDNREQEEISIVEIFFHYLRRWKWFAFSIPLCLGLAYVYLLFLTPKYKVVSTVLISDDRKGQTVEMISVFNDLGVGNPKSNLDNEIEILRSRTLMRSVADSLKIGVSYYKKGRIKNVEIYKKTPVFVSVPYPKAFGSFTVDLVSDGILSVRSEQENFNQQIAVDEDLNSPWGLLNFSLNSFGTETFPIEVLIKNTDLFLPNVSVTAVNKTSSVVELSMITATPQKGQDIINTLIAQYNRNAIDDKNYVARSTMEFIDDRLLVVSGDLREAEKNVVDYQMSQGITDLQVQGNLLLSSSSDYAKKITDQDIQLDFLSQIKAFLLNSANQNKAIPSNVGITDPTVISSINKYNEVNSEMQRTTVGALENHPLRLEYNNRIAALRDQVLNGIDLAESAVQASKREFQRQEGISMGRARNLTSQERQTRDLSRQQVQKESIYNYLVQKREDTGLALVTATPNAKVIDPAFFSSVPVLPKKKIILLAALMLGILIPVGLIFLLDLFDNKVHTKDDVTKVISAPFLGVLPVLKTNAAGPFPVMKLRSSMAERFRSIISNLEFILGKRKKKIISVTSFTSGDGKSFFSRNLAMSLAILGKKTLLIDLDLRKSVLTKNLEKISKDEGVEVFLSNSAIKLKDIIDTSKVYHKNLDIIPVVISPPNPAELLSSDRLEQLFQTIEDEEDYEYVIIDTAPIGLVSDIFSFNSYSMATIFLIRSDYSFRKILPEIQELYDEKKLNNLSVVLNAVSDENIHGYGQYGSYKHNYYTDEN